MDGIDLLVDVDKEIEAVKIARDLKNSVMHNTDGVVRDQDDQYVIYLPSKDKYIGLGKISKQPYWVDKKHRDIFTLEEVGNIINDIHEAGIRVIKLS